MGWSSKYPFIPWKPFSCAPIQRGDDFWFGLTHDSGKNVQDVISTSTSSSSSFIIIIIIIIIIVYLLCCHVLLHKKNACVLKSRVWIAEVLPHPSHGLGEWCRGYWCRLEYQHPQLQSSRYHQAQQKPKSGAKFMTGQPTPPPEIWPYYGLINRCFPLIRPY